MNGKNFAKGMGIGLIMGSAIGMAVSDPAKKHQKKNMVSKALKTMGDIVDNIGGSIGM